MKFSDKKERDPEEWVYIIRSAKDLEMNKNIEIVRELTQPDKKLFCKIQVKHLSIGDGFCNSEGCYVSRREE